MARILIEGWNLFAQRVVAADPDGDFDIFARNRASLALLLCLAFAIICALEPWLGQVAGAPASHLLRECLAVGFGLNILLLRRRNLRMATYVLCGLLACFVCAHFLDGMLVPWVFVLPPVIVFLTSLRSGMVVLGGIGIVEWLTVLFAKHDLHELWPASPDAALGFAIAAMLTGGIVWHLKSSAERMAFAAFRDQLTGLYQRSMFLELGEHALAVAKRGGNNLTVLVLDLDDFKAVNDRLGHSRGDLVLTDAASAMQRGLRGSDILARFGGDEFLALLPGTDKWNARIVVERLQRLVREAPLISRLSSDFSLTLSAGVASFPEDGDSLEELFEAADKALLSAKKAGKNCMQLSGVRESPTS
ncbi:MAG: GGDEF domain-containing protein [Gammaproteobacteria bacterium]|jgi:diguanylate cyclase (GGDEF)-like protein